MTTILCADGRAAVTRASPKSAVRLFCFPYSGANAWVYQRWGDGLPGAIDVCPVELPGHGTLRAMPLCTRIQPLVEQVARALTPYLDPSSALAAPFAFFGHSMGALLAFELARYLRREHKPMPVYLFVSGHGAPHLPDREPPIHDLPEPEFVAKIREFNGTPDEVLENQELRELILPVLRADFEICATYEYRAEEPLACPIGAFGGLRDPSVAREDLEAWRLQTNAGCSVRMFPGDHFFIGSDRSTILWAIGQDLNRVVNLAPAAWGATPRRLL
jgi:medium-chain acyl-[acyl-carrier-protein] hydrolase